MGKRGCTSLNAVAKKKDQRKSSDANPALAARIRSALTGNPNPQIAAAPPPPTPVAQTARSTGSSSSCGQPANLDTDRFQTARASAPEIIAGGRASYRDALNAAASQTSRQEARLNFELGKAANSVRATNASL